jgi:hypothetical protein
MNPMPVVPPGGTYNAGDTDVDSLMTIHQVVRGEIDNAQDVIASAPSPFDLNERTDVIPSIEASGRIRRVVIAIFTASCVALMVLGIMAIIGFSGQDWQDSEVAALHVPEVVREQRPALAVAMVEQTAPPTDIGKAGAIATSGAVAVAVVQPAVQPTAQSTVPPTDEPPIQPANQEAATEASDSAAATGVDERKPALSRETRKVQRHEVRRAGRPAQAVASTSPERQRARVAYQEGVKLFVGGQLASARLKFREAIRWHQGYASPYRGLGLLYEREGNRAKAVRVLKQYLKLAPGASDAAKIRDRVERLGG